VSENANPRIVRKANDPGPDDTVKWLSVYGDRLGGLVCIEYHGEPLSIAQVGPVVANLLSDVLGHAPTVRNVAQLQQVLTTALSGKGD